MPGEHFAARWDACRRATDDPTAAVERFLFGDRAEQAVHATRVGRRRCLDCRDVADLLRVPPFPSRCPDCLATLLDEHADRVHPAGPICTVHPGGGDG
jgi:hypothetical protein